MEKKSNKTGVTSETMVTPNPTTTNVKTDIVEKPRRRTKLRPTPVQLGWTEQRKKAVTTHLKDLATILLLQDWTIKVMWDKYCEEFDDSYATNTPIGDSRHCEVRFSKKFLELEDHEMTQVLVHELLHCHMFAVDDYAEEIVAELASKKTSAVFNLGHTKLLETAIDGMADAIARLVPQFVLPQR